MRVTSRHVAPMDPMPFGIGAEAVQHLEDHRPLGLSVIVADGSLEQHPLTELEAMPSFAVHSPCHPHWGDRGVRLPLNQKLERVDICSLLLKHGFRRQHSLQYTKIKTPSHNKANLSASKA